jgi:HK97 family phage major capsid protein/HK97 family phage prohead protease
MQLQALIHSRDADHGGLVWFRATSEAKDRHGTVIESAGVDVEPFLRNPVVGWGHRTIRGGDPDDVLGRVDAIERGDSFIDVGVRFADHERAQLTAKLVRDGFLSAMSVGILPRKTSTRKVDGVNTPVIERSELLEVSIVPVGSNPEAQRLLRELAGDSPADEGGEEMEANELRQAVTDAVTPLAARFEAIEKALDEPERVPALGGARTTEGVDDLAGRWLKARAFNDQRTLLEIAEADPAPEAEVRNMLSANAYLPTEVGTQLITLVGYTSKFFNVLGRVTGSDLAIKLPRESTKLSASFIAENTTVISGSAALDSVTLTAHNAWAGERVPNRVIADSPVPTAALLLRQAADALAAHLDTKVVIGTTGSGIDPTSGLADLTSSSPVHDDTPGTSTAADFVNQISSEYFALDYRVRPRATWVINATYAQLLSNVLDSTSRPVFALAGGVPSATIDEGNSDSRLFGRPVIVSSDVASNVAYLGDLSRALMIYLRQGLVAESSRDAEFSLDNTLFRFGMRWDVAIVEPNQIKKFAA